MVVSVVALVAMAHQPLAKRWVYLATNLLVDANVERDIALVKRAKAAGYNGIVVNDSKFCRWDDLPKHYLDNVDRFRGAVKDAGMELVVGVCPIGYSNDLLSRDPDLAEAIPVVDGPFRAESDGTLKPVMDSDALRNPGFEEGSGPTPAGWAWVDGPGTICVVDRAEKSEGSASLMMHDARGGNARASQPLKVKPFHSYHVRVDVKTEALDSPGSVNILILAKNGQALQHRSLPIKPTMGWTPIDVVFNSLDNTDVNFYVGVWGLKSGQIWWDNIRLEPAGLVNLVRRPGAPFKVKDKDGETLIEGKDYALAKDPKTGRIAWPGDYDTWHEAPAWNVPEGSRIHAGDTVFVSYSQAALIYDGQVTVCLGEPKVYEVLKWQIQQVHEHLHPDGYFLSHDEIRVGGWDEGCTKTGKSPGALLADNVRRCEDMIRGEDPGKPIYAWSDMFDPFHNAKRSGTYYLLKGEGPWKDSWLGLSKDVTVVNWNTQEDARKPSLDFFAQRGHKQILAGYYDGGGVSIAQWMREARAPYGVMYTTWQSNYNDLEKFAREAGFSGGSR
ncbi:MAG: hypothetical protein JSS66_03870 [Armatimonadetes bacterium]|nr:hypothetical protein [Armatimonadota bacterium]